MDARALRWFLLTLDQIRGCFDRVSVGVSAAAKSRFHTKNFFDMALEAWSRAGRIGVPAPQYLTSLNSYALSEARLSARPQLRHRSPAEVSPSGRYRFFPPHHAGVPLSGSRAPSPDKTSTSGQPSRRFGWQAQVQIREVTRHWEYGHEMAPSCLPCCLAGCPLLSRRDKRRQLPALFRLCWRSRHQH